MDDVKDLGDFTGRIRLKNRTLLVENGRVVSAGFNGVIPEWGLRFEGGLAVEIVERQQPQEEKPCGGPTV